MASEQDIQAARRLQGKLMADIDTAAIPFIADAIAQARQEGEAAGFRCGVEALLSVVQDWLSPSFGGWVDKYGDVGLEEAIRNLLPPDTAATNTEAEAAKTSPD